MDNTISIYGHSGSYNHGNEAVVRGLCNIMQFTEKPNLYCTSPYIDQLFGLDDKCNLIPEGTIQQGLFERVVSKAASKLTRSDRSWLKHKYSNLLENVYGTYLFTAEDQYCEPRRVVEWFEYQNKEINRKGGKTVAVGCTINDYLVGQSVKLKDLERYTLLIARESLTYQTLKSHGLNVILAPCTAFALEEEEWNLPSVFSTNEVIGINAGPIAQGNEKYANLYYRNCIELIKYILSETTYDIALIPHMNWSGIYSDINMHEKLHKEFNYNKRITLIKEHNAPQQKYVIGKCKMIVTVRTHVSIPAYAKCVPTLVTGYKIKSIGIATDIFGNSENYVVPIQELESEKDFVKGFKWLADNREKISTHLQSVMPSYIQKTESIKNEINKIAIKNGE